MKEIEVKVLDVDAVRIKETLVGLGASKVFEGFIQASLFDFPDGRLDRDNSFLRLRTKGDQVELAFKKAIPNQVAKSYEELEVQVSDPTVALKIIESLGLMETVRGRHKHRTSYSLDGAHFELDTFDGMPTFLEIEVSDSGQLEKWVGLLGFSMKDAKAWGSREIYGHYGIEYPRV